ncbi:hypothetical protein Tco_1418002 [Tanacetum coccineum]
MLVLVVMQYRMSKIRLFLANNAVQNVENQVVQNAIQYPGVPNVRNQNCLIVVQGIANQNVNQNGNGNVVTARAEGNGNRNNEYQILCYRLWESIPIGQGVEKGFPELNFLPFYY